MNKWQKLIKLKYKDRKTEGINNRNRQQKKHKGEDMVQVRLGKTEIVVNKNGFGALPIQRISDEAAVALLNKAYDGGIRFFDTARAYSDSEHKVGLSFEKKRESLYIATKTGAQT